MRWEQRFAEQKSVSFVVSGSYPLREIGVSFKQKGSTLFHKKVNLFIEHAI